MWQQINRHKSMREYSQVDKFRVKMKRHFPNESCNRDIKPSNILTLGSSVFISDWGLAKVLSAPTSSILYNNDEWRTDWISTLNPLVTAAATRHYMPSRPVSEAVPEPTLMTEPAVISLACLYLDRTSALEAEAKKRREERQYWEAREKEDIRRAEEDRQYRQRWEEDRQRWEEDRQRWDAREKQLESRIKKLENDNLKVAAAAAASAAATTATDSADAFVWPLEAS
jgi:hypothetical protein